RFAYDSLSRLADESIEPRSAFHPELFAPSATIPAELIPHRQAAINAATGDLKLPTRARTYLYDLSGNRQKERPSAGGDVEYLVHPLLDQYESRDGVAFT